MKDRSKLCIHTITTKPWDLETAVNHYARAGVKGITVWRDALEGRNPAEAGRMIGDAGLEIVSFCRGGFFPARLKKDRRKAVRENEKIIDEAAELGAPMIVLVCGADPSQPLNDSRLQIEEGINEVKDRAKKAGVKLAVEPLHPMYADTRSAINTMKQANELCDRINDSNVGIAVDVYHLWWDPGLGPEIRRAGKKKRLFAFHVCDWRTPTEDILFDRGLMGEGCIDIKEIRGWMETDGFNGYNEVEIFSNRYWTMDQSRYLDMILEADRDHV
ncbi:MAG: sugar phosphate isomerase/epimerase family protein [Spirochaetia bacterium]